MYSGTFVFSQVVDHLPIRVFRKCVRRYGGNRYVKSFPCLSQFLCMAFAQLTHRESLRDIENGLRAHGTSSTTGHSRQRVAQHARQRQQTARRADLRGVRAGTDPHCTAAPRRRRLRTGTRRHGVRARRLHHRPVPVGLPVGAVPLHEVGGQAPRASRPARQHPHVRPCFAPETGRRERPRPAAAGARRVLRDPREVEHEIPPPVFPRRGQVRGRPVRPDRRPDGHDVEGRLPETDASPGQDDDGASAPGSPRFPPAARSTATNGSRRGDRTAATAADAAAVNHRGPFRSAQRVNPRRPAPPSARRSSRAGPGSSPRTPRHASIRAARTPPRDSRRSPS